MPRSLDSDAFFRRGASMSQQLSAKESIYSELAGVDPEISESIGVLRVLINEKILKETSTVKLLLSLLNVQRQARFATSERVNEITKMGLQMPRKDKVYRDE